MSSVRLIWTCAVLTITGSSLQQSASAQTAYDGNYAGSMTIAQDRKANQIGVFGNRGAVRGDSNGRMRPCNAGPYSKTLTIRNGQFSFVYNREFPLIFTGNVGSDGAVAAFLPSAQGGVTLAARITGADLVGTVGGAYCVYSLQLRKGA
jgi:hypothetical protein